jgi:hypothetical protein
MKIYIITLAAALSLASAPCRAQEITIGTIMDLEDQIVLKKLNEELRKPSANAPLPVPLPPPPPQKVYPTQTLAVYGMSPDYEAQVTHGGTLYQVKVGARVGAYKVAAISPFGAELRRPGQPVKRGKGKPVPQDEILFAPLAAR